ncbi:MAG: ribonuclease HI [Burkholderiaceae bacterium]
MKQISVYTDGACKGNPGPGGWGALLVCGEHERELFGGEPRTTNNRMELLAVIRALEAIDKPLPLTIYTDSQYVMKGITEWLAGWRARGWLTAARKPVKNVDLWQALSEQVDRFDVRWQWVRGHTGHPGNERADQLANRGVAQGGAGR